MTDINPDRTLRHELVSLQREAVDWTPEGVWALRERIHVLLDHIRRTGSNGHGPAQLQPRFDELLGLTADLWSMLEGIRETGDSVTWNRTARWLGAAADATGMMEQLIASENPGGEVVAHAVPFTLHRASETSYVRSAEIGYRALAREHQIRLTNALWRRPRERGEGIEVSQRRRGEIDQVLTAVRHPDLEPSARLALIAFIYAALIRAALRDLAEESRSH